MKSKRQQKMRITLVGLLLLTIPALAQQKHDMTVQQAVDFALKNSAQVKNALLDVKMQEQVNKEITANAYPRINGSLGSTYNASIATQVIPDFISPATYGVLVQEGVKDGNGNPIQMPSNFGVVAAQFGTKWSTTAAISLAQILFDGQVFVGLQARDASMRFREVNASLTEEQIKANVHKVYYQLVIGKKQIELLDANIDRINKLLNDTRAIFSNGFAEKLDVQKVEVGLANLQTEKIRVNNLISNGYYGLKLLIGMPIQDELVLTDTLSEDQIKEGVLEAANFTYENRKEFQVAQLGKSLNEYNIRRYKLSQIPTVALVGTYAKNAQRDKFNFFNRGDWFTISNIGLNISVPIFNGFSTKAKIQQAKIDLQKTENQIESLKLLIDNEIGSAKNNFSSAVKALDFQKKNMELAETVYNQTKKKYESGLGSQSEINLAQTELKAAQTNYISDLYDAIIAKVDFLKATGKL